jgi:hypothetical protein
MINPTVPRQLPGTGAISGGRVSVIVFVNKEVEPNAKLSHLRGALYSPGFGFGAGQGGKQQSGQDGNDGDDHQEFN